MASRHGAGAPVHGARDYDGAALIPRELYRAGESASACVTFQVVLPIIEADMPAPIMEPVESAAAPSQVPLMVAAALGSSVTAMFHCTSPSRPPERRVLPETQNLTPVRCCSLFRG